MGADGPDGPAAALDDRCNHLALGRLARRVAQSPHDLPADEDLAAAADRLIVELDGREQSE